MYTKEDYKNEIKKYMKDKSYNPLSIAKRTYEILYLDHIREIDSELRDKLLDIAHMEMGPEFEMTEKQFMEYIQ